MAKFACSLLKPGRKWSCGNVPSITGKLFSQSADVATKEVGVGGEVAPARVRSRVGPYDVAATGPKGDGRSCGKSHDAREVR